VDGNGVRQGLGKRGAALLSMLSATAEEVFTISEAKSLPNTKDKELRDLLYHLAANKWIERIERGKYLLLPLEAGAKARYGTHPFIIARKLVNPYYVGFASALNYYGITEQPARTTYLATTKSKKPLAFHNQEFRFVFFKPKRFFGYSEEWMGNLKFNISEKEKTIVDCLFLPKYGGGITEVAKAFKEKIDYGKLYDYAIRMDRLAVVKRLGYLLETLELSPRIVEKLSGKVEGGYCLLDASGARTGEKNNKWRVIDNVGKRELRLEP